MDIIVVAMVRKLATMDKFHCQEFSVDTAGTPTQETVLTAWVEKYGNVWELGCMAPSEKRQVWNISLVAARQDEKA